MLSRCCRVLLSHDLTRPPHHTRAYPAADECWIAYHPVLLLGYLMQYAPWLGMRVLKRVGPPRVAALREGRSGYDTGTLLRSGASAASISQ